MKSNLLLPFPFYLQPTFLRQPLSTALDSSFSAGFEGTSKVLVLYDMVILYFMIDQPQTFIGSPILIARAWLAAFQNAKLFPDFFSPYPFSIKFLKRVIRFYYHSAHHCSHHFQDWPYPQAHLHLLLDSFPTFFFVKVYSVPLWGTKV